MNIDFEGLIAGQPFDGNKAANFTVVLGEKRMLPDFEAALVGMKAGEQKTFPLVFPQDYAEAVKGKTADFTVTVNQVAEPRPPELDAEFAKTLGVDDGDVARLKREVRENMEKEVGKRVKAAVKEQVMRRPARLPPASRCPRRSSTGKSSACRTRRWKTSSSAA